MWRRKFAQINSFKNSTKKKNYKSNTTNNLMNQVLSVKITKHIVNQKN
jgi:hypothetical protein